MGKASLKLDLRHPTQVEVSVYDAAGRRVRMLTRGLLGAGEHPLVWDGSNETGNQMGAGVYWIRAVMSDRRETVRLVRLR
jgi:flagellar hook assembly protein FlgD